MNSSVNPAHLPPKAAYNHWVAAAGPLRDVGHYRIVLDGEPAPVHVALVIGASGRVYAGVAVCRAQLDSYSRKRGHTIALGRALKVAAAPMGLAVAELRDDGLAGIELRDYLAPLARGLAEETVKRLRAREENA